MLMSHAETLGRLDARIDALLTHAPIILFAFDRSGRITCSAGKGLRGMGLESGELVGRSIYDVYRDFPWLLQSAQSALEGEGVLARGDVHGTFLEVHYVPRIDSDGNVFEVTGVATDITERQRAYEALDESRQSYKDLIDSIDGIVWEVDVDTFQFTFVSLQAERILGYPVEQWKEPDFWTSHLHPQDHEWAPRFCQRATAERRAHQFDYRMIAADGRDVWLRDIVTVVDKDGKLTLRGVMVDITPLKAAEQDRARLLAEARGSLAVAQAAEEHSRDLAERLRALADASLSFSEASVDFAAVVMVVVQRVGTLMGDACFLRLVSEDGEWFQPVATYHPKAARMEAIQRMFSHHPQRTNEGITPTVLQTAKPLRATNLTTEWVHARIKREYWDYFEGVSSLVIAPLRIGGRVIGAMTVARDRPGPAHTKEDEMLIGDLAIRAAQALEVSRLFQESQEAVRARDEFLSIASHELRTPLSAALLQIQTIRRFEAAHPGASAGIPGGLAVLEQQLLRLADLTDDLLDVSKLRLGLLETRPEEFDLPLLVQRVVAHQEKAIARSGSSVIIRAPVPVIGLWDAMRMEQVIESLLSNALKFGEGRPIEIEVTTDGTEARLLVRDHGMGIPEAMQARIFDRFERAVSLRHFGGLGLGLYVARRIVESHGGTITVQSAPQRGSTFTVELPLRHGLSSTAPISVHDPRSSIAGRSAAVAPGLPAS
jgi:PAS domain S-box-containing protein